MSDNGALKELASFAAKSPHASDNPAVRRSAMNTLITNLDHQPIHRKVTDLLGTVMALSARTRRMLQPRVDIDLDVFAPGNSRAVRLLMRDNADIS